MKLDEEMIVIVLLNRYEERLKNMIVMDDYDGGEASMLRSVIGDLKMISDQADKALTDSFEADKMED